MDVNWDESLNSGANDDYEYIVMAHMDHPDMTTIYATEDFIVYNPSVFNDENPFESAGGATKLADAREDFCTWLETGSTSTTWTQ